jgi:aromatic-L-amino-acid decarboxylase
VAIGSPTTTRAHVERVWALLREGHDWLAADFAAAAAERAAEEQRARAAAEEERARAAAEQAAAGAQTDAADQEPADQAVDRAEDQDAEASPAEA